MWESGPVIFMNNVTGECYTLQVSGCVQEAALCGLYDLLDTSCDDREAWVQRRPPLERVSESQLAIRN